MSKIITVEITDEQYDALASSGRGGLGRDPQEHYSQEILQQANHALTELNKNKVSEVAEKVGVTKSIDLLNGYGDVSIEIKTQVENLLNL